MRFGIRTILTLVAIACVTAAGFSFVLAQFRPLSPGYYAKYLDIDPRIYLQIEELTASEFGRRIYAYDENQFVHAINGAERKPQVSDDDGRVPALKFDGDTYIILAKWVNESSGLAISDCVDFPSKLVKYDDDFVVAHMHGNIYYWHLDLERDSYR